jgi:predicted HicB family RNase H-like nuclease
VSDSPGLRKAPDADLHPSTPVVAEGQASLLRVGATAADAVGGPDRDKLVDLDVKVPKSLRKAVRAEAKRRGMSIDALVAEALRDRTAR